MTERSKLTFIQCHIDEAHGLVDASQENPYDNEPGYREYVSEALKHCRCAGLWAPCGGVLAGGVCDELGDEDE